MKSRQIKRRCTHKKRDGSPCPNLTRSGKTTCWVHDPELAEKRAEGRRRGGVNRNKPAATLPLNEIDAPLSTVADVATFLAATMNHVRTGRLAVSVGNCLFVGAGVLLKALEIGNLEQRIAALENQQNRKIA